MQEESIKVRRVPNALLSSCTAAVLHRLVTTPQLQLFCAVSFRLLKKDQSPVHLHFRCLVDSSAKEKSVLVLGPNLYIQSSSFFQAVLHGKATDMFSDCIKCVDGLEDRVHTPPPLVVSGKRTGTPLEEHFLEILD